MVVTIKIFQVDVDISSRHKSVNFIRTIRLSRDPSDFNVQQDTYLTRPSGFGGTSIA